MIGTICTLVLAAALLAWMWLFEVRLAHLLNLAEQLVEVKRRDGSRPGQHRHNPLAEKGSKP